MHDCRLVATWPIPLPNGHCVINFASPKFSEQNGQNVTQLSCFLMRTACG